MIIFTQKKYLKSLIKDKTLPSQTNFFVEGLSIDGDTISQLNEFDPKVLNFNNFRFIGNVIFDGSFSPDNVLEEFSIKNSHLIDDQGNGLQCSRAFSMLRFIKQ